MSNIAETAERQAAKRENGYPFPLTWRQSQNPNHWYAEALPTELICHLSQTEIGVWEWKIVDSAGAVYGNRNDSREAARSECEARAADIFQGALLRRIKQLTHLHSSLAAVGGLE